MIRVKSSTTEQRAKRDKFVIEIAKAPIDPLHMQTKTTMGSIRSPLIDVTSVDDAANRRLQSGSSIFVETMILFTMMIALSIVMWLACRYG